ncbi:MAG: Holliday junction branch migration protein RuvA, partial [Schwartzia succinivorans]|nr:Holliday junction branch migration protein RuvA [Schwartzia succinivorans]
MIGFLRGRVAHLLADCCLLDVGGVGYRVYIASATRSRLHMGEEATLFTHLSVREDALTLYGFYSQEEYDIFQQLISVSGIGPKVALGILSAISVDKLCAAIHGQQLTVLTKLPGIGKKSAQRLILELKDKIAAGSGDIAADDVSDTPVVGDDTIS